MKKLAYLILIIVVIGGIMAYYQWNKPHEKVEDMQGLTVDAVQLCKDFAANEAKATKTYTGKVLEVKGAITDVQNNGKVIVLQGIDETSSVQCNMRDSGNNANKGANITIKGFFSDNSMFGPTLTDCVIKN
jgi:hypothetical protein